MCLRDGKDGENHSSSSSKLKELKGQAKESSSALLCWRRCARNIWGARQF